MKTILLKTILSLFFVAIAISCGPPPPPGLEAFNYAENNSPTMIFMDNPEASALAKKIAGKSTTSSAVIDIKLTSLAVGTYTLGSGTGNEFVYKKPGVANPWTGLIGTITITTNSGGLLYGTFDIKGGTGIGSVNMMKGDFSDVVIQ